MSASAPPAITVSRRSRAKPGPPETGASTQRMPQRASSSRAIDSVGFGMVVEWSTRSAPRRPASATPPGPSVTSCTASVSSTHSEHHVGLRRHLGRVSGEGSAAGGEGVERLGLAVPDDEAAAVVEQHPGHRAAHQPQADEPDRRVLVQAAPPDCQRADPYPETSALSRPRKRAGAGKDPTWEPHGVGPEIVAKLLGRVAVRQLA